MNTGTRIFQPIFRYVVAVVVIIVIAAGVLIAVSYSFEKALYKRQGLLEDYHFMSLTLTEQLLDAVDTLERLTRNTNGGLLYVGESERFISSGSLLYSLRARVSDLQALQVKYRVAAFDGTLARLSNRMERTANFIAGGQTEDAKRAHLELLKVNIEQLRRLHSIAADKLMARIKSDRKSRDRAAVGFVAAIVAIAAVLTGFLTRLLRNALKRQEEIEQALASSRERVHQMQKLEALGQLVGGVAHDFNNLLTPILGLTGLLRVRQNIDEQTRDELNQVHKAAEQASSLTKQLLAFSRRKPVDSRDIDLNELIRNMEPMLDRILGESIEMVMTCAESAPLVTLDTGQAEQIIVNLSVNARDAMPNGGQLCIGTDEVHVDAPLSARLDIPEGRYTRLRVSDNGVGMDSDTRARLFEPFFTTKPRGRGTGLGLATVHGIVTGSNGHIFVESRPGDGARFDIFFPQSTRQLAAESAVVEEGPYYGSSETVLVVEDEEQIIEFLRIGLAARGFRVLTASSGAAALEICVLEPDTIDVIISDVIMPDINGPAFVERALKLRPEAVAIYMSGYTDDIVLKSGASDHEFPIIYKPFEIDAVARLICKQFRKTAKGMGGVAPERGHTETV